MSCADPPLWLQTSKELNESLLREYETIHLWMDDFSSGSRLELIVLLPRLDESESVFVNPSGDQGISMPESA